MRNESTLSLFWAFVARTYTILDRTRLKHYNLRTLCVSHSVTPQRRDALPPSAGGAENAGLENAGAITDEKQ